MPWIKPKELSNCFMRVPKRKSEEKVKRENGPFLITAAGLDKLKHELVQAEKDLPEHIAEVERTKGFGDFSENAAYQDAKATMRRTHGRIARLQDRIKRAVIIEQRPNTSGKIEIGSTVVLQMAAKKFTFEILGFHEADPSTGRISDRSPLGRALLGHSAGETVTLEVKNGMVEYRIVKIR